MTEPQVLVRRPKAPREVGFPEDPGTAWRLMTWVGFGLAVVAYGDLALALYPIRVGNPQWEFGTISRVFDSMPLVTMATLLFFSGSVARGRKWAVRAVGAWSILVGALLLIALVLYALTVPLALKAVTEPLALTGLKKAIIKACMQGIAYSTMFLAIGLFGWRTPARHRGRSQRTEDAKEKRTDSNNQGIKEMAT